MDFRTTPAGELLIVLILSTWLVPCVAVCLLDAWLAEFTRTTISQFVWDHPWAGVPVIGWTLIGPAFLVAHFYFGFLR